MPAPYEFRFNQNASNVTWTDTSGTLHVDDYTTGQTVGPFSACDAFRFLNGTIEAGVPLQASAEQIYLDVADDCAATGGDGGTAAIPPTPPPDPDPSASTPDTSPPAGGDTSGTLNAPDPGPGFNVEPTPAPSDAPDTRPFIVQYYAPNPTDEYDIVGQLLAQGASPDDVNSLMDGIVHNDPEVGEAHPQFGLDDNVNFLQLVDPVDIFAGSYTLSVTDVQLPSQGFPLHLTRRYRSGRVYFGPWGYNWDHNYNVYLRELTDGRVAIWTGAHSEDVYTPRAAGGFDPPVGVFLNLERLTAIPTDPDRYVLSDRDGRMQVFYPPPGWPRADRIPLVRLEDRHGNRHKLAYDAEGRLAQVADEAGRSLTFAYGDCGLLEHVVDHTGREWRYWHDPDAEHLIAAITPGTAEYPDGLTTQYLYDRYREHPQLRHNIIAVIGPDERVAVENEYSSDPSSDDFGRVVRQEYGGYEAIFTATRLQFVPRLPDAINVPALRVEVIDPGVLHVYTFNYRGDLLDHRFRLVLDGSYRAVARTSRYDEQGNLSERREPNGLGMVYTFDAANSDPRARGNLLKAELVGPPTAAVLSRIISRVTYEPVFHRPKTHRDEHGHTTTWVYDHEEGTGTAGDVVRVEYPAATLPDGTSQPRVETFSYAASGGLEEHVTAEGHAHRFEYGAAGPAQGLLTRIVQDAGGAAQSETYEYDARGARVAIVDGLGRRTESPRNELGQITVVRLPAIAGTADEVRFRYTPTGLVWREELPRGEFADGVIPDDFIANEYAYDVLGHLERARYGVNTARPLAASFVHDADGRVLQVNDEIGRRTEFRYDERGGVLRWRQAVGTPVEAEARYHYDRNGNLTQLRDPAGYEFDYDYDPWDRLRRLILPGAPEVDRTRIEFELNDFDRPDVVRVVGKTALGAVGVLTERTSDYDERGRAWRHRVGARSVTITHDTDERPIRFTDQRGATATWEYDGLDRLINVQDAGGNEVARTYDAAGQLVLIERRDVLPTGGSESMQAMIDYDARGRVTRVEDPLGNVTQSRYDARDMATTEIDPLGRETNRAFDIRGDLVSSAAEAAPGLPVQHHFDYDAAGRIVSYTDPEGRTTAFEWDDRDRRTTITYADGRAHRFEYGERLQTDAETTPGGTRIQYTYGADAGLERIAFTPAAGVAPTPDIVLTVDGLRRAVRLVHGAVEVRRAYDAHERLVAEAVDGRTTAVTYDDLAGTALFTHPDGRVDRFEFDAMGRLASLSLDAPGPAGLTGTLAGGTVLGRYTYRGSDRIARREQANGTVTDFEFDAAARLSAIAHRDAGGTPVSIARYLRDAAEERRLVWAAPVPQAPTRFDYDGTGRLLHAELDVPAPEPPVAPDQPTADAAIAASLAAAGAISEDYSLTRTDARTADSVNDAGSAVTTAYTLTPADQIIGVTRVGGPSAGAFPFVFDGDGRCTQDDRHTYTYDALGQLVEARLIGGPVILQQAFDGAGRVVRRTENGTAEQFAYHGPRVVEVAAAGGAPLRQFTFGIGTDEALMESDGQNAFPHQDALTSVVARTDELGAVLERYAYTPFGEASIFAPDGVTTRASSTIGARPWFAGHPLLDCGLYDARARLYDPRLGRFIQPDPLGLAGSRSPYTYAYHDPVGLVDPTGEVAIVIGLLVVAGIGAAAGLGFNAARQGIQLHEGSRDEFSVGELLGSGLIGAVAAPIFVVAPELVIPAAAWGVAGGVNEISQGNWETGTFDIVTSVLPFASRRVRTGAWGEGSYVGQGRGLGPATPWAQRWGRIPQIGTATRDLAGRGWNARFYHGTTQQSALAVIRDPTGALRVVRVVQQYPGARHLGPGLYFTRNPGNPATTGSAAWWASRGGSTGQRGPGAVLVGSIPRWRLAFLRRNPGVQVDVPQAGVDAPQSFFPFEGPVASPRGPAMRFGELARWSIWDPNAPQPGFTPLWPTLLTPQVTHWPSSPSGSTAPK